MSIGSEVGEEQILASLCRILQVSLGGRNVEGGLSLPQVEESMSHMEQGMMFECDYTCPAKESRYT